MTSAPLNPPPSDTKRTLRIGVVAGVGTLDPREVGDTITGLVLGQIFEMAYRVTESGAIEPQLFAGSLVEERSGENPVYLAAVRDGVVFSDGTPLTAELAAASLAKAGDPSLAAVALPLWGQTFGHSTQAQRACASAPAEVLTASWLPRSEIRRSDPSLAALTPLSRPRMLRLEA